MESARGRASGRRGRTDDLQLVPPTAIIHHVQRKQQERRHTLLPTIAEALSLTQPRDANRGAPASLTPDKLD